MLALQSRNYITNAWEVFQYEGGRSEITADSSGVRRVQVKSYGVNPNLTIFALEKEPSEVAMATYLTRIRRIVGIYLQETEKPSMALEFFSNSLSFSLLSNHSVLTYDMLLDVATIIHLTLKEFGCKRWSLLKVADV